MSAEELNVTPEDIDVTPSANIEDDPFAGLGESPSAEPEEEAEEVAETPAEEAQSEAVAETPAEEAQSEAVAEAPAEEAQSEAVVEEAATPPRSRGPRGMPNHIPVRYHTKGQPYANRLLTVNPSDKTGTFTMTEADGKVRTFSFEMDEISVQ